jgi:hypothetical protein
MAAGKRGSSGSEMKQSLPNCKFGLWIGQGTLTEGEVSVQLTSTLRKVVL